jgi:uncharacterized membrane protein YedE/YeeE
VPPRGELAKGTGGGLLMGVGAMLAFGCNVGGFFSAMSALSLSGFGMMLGLGLGASWGCAICCGSSSTVRAGRAARRACTVRAATTGPSRQPLAGLVVVIALLVLPFLYARQGFHTQGVFLLFGVVFGVIFQRSRFCLVRAFREPFMTGDAEHTRAAALALAVSTLGFAILKFVDLKDKGDWVFPGAGIGALAGGTIFGIGMTLAGGCGAGSIWRAGEGRSSSGPRSSGSRWGASLMRLALVQTGTLSKLGWAVFLPSMLGWGAAVVLTLLVVVAWAVAATWNEDSRAVSVLD